MPTEKDRETPSPFPQAYARKSLLAELACSKRPVYLGELLVCSEVLRDVGELAGGAEVDGCAFRARLVEVPVAVVDVVAGVQAASQVYGSAGTGRDVHAYGVVCLGGLLKREIVLGGCLDVLHVDAELGAVLQLRSCSGGAGQGAVCLHDHVDLGGSLHDELVGVGLQVNGSGSRVAGGVGKRACSGGRGQGERRCSCAHHEACGDEAGCCVAGGALLDGRYDSHDDSPLLDYQRYLGSDGAAYCRMAVNIMSLCGDGDVVRPWIEVLGELRLLDAVARCDEVGLVDDRAVLQSEGVGQIAMVVREVVDDRHRIAVLVGADRQAAAPQGNRAARSGTQRAGQRELPKAEGEGGEVRREDRRGAKSGDPQPHPRFRNRHVLCPLGSPRTQGKTLKAGAVLMVPAILAGVLTTACLACAR